MGPKITVWLKAARLRTLPLAFSCILLGSFIAYEKGVFNLSIFLLALLTTLFLQVLSNFANDYGDAVSGVDGDNRVGPARAIQSGEISKKEMMVAVIVFSLLSLVSGIYLVTKGTSGLQSTYFLIFLILGFLAIGAAIKYTIGKKPYGYRGLGDFFVFLFFGLVGVGGTYFMHAKEIHPLILLPACSVGLLSVGVLNLNNMRDLEADRASGKITLAVLLGIDAAKVYHYTLISMAIVCSIIYVIMNYNSPFQFLFLLTLPLFIKHISVVAKTKNAVLLDPQLKKLALSTFVFVLVFGAGIILN